MSVAYDSEKMRDRLRDVLREQKAQGVSQREVAKRAGLGHGYLTSVLTEGKEPSVAHLASVCDALNISLGWLLFGYQMSPETERLILLIERNPTRRDGILALLDDEATSQRDH